MIGACVDNEVEPLFYIFGNCDHFAQKQYINFLHMVVCTVTPRVDNIEKGECPTSTVSQTSPLLLCTVANNK